MKAHTQRAAKAEPFIVAWVVVFLVAEVTAILIIQVGIVAGWWE